MNVKYLYYLKHNLSRIQYNMISTRNRYKISETGKYTIYKNTKTKQEHTNYKAQRDQRIATKKIRGFLHWFADLSEPFLGFADYHKIKHMYFIRIQ